MTAIPVVDVFAGPGGLNEGFSSLLDAHGNSIFETVNSFEMESAAVNTLRLRAALRTIRRNTGSTPNAAYRFLRGELSYGDMAADPDVSAALKDAESEVRQLELGQETRLESDAIIRGSLQSTDDPWILVGGPPCQAYSLAGRSRRTNDPTFVHDEKHFLYREYLHILQQHRPTVFVMENVKGMLSSRHDGGSIFRKILDDLRSPAFGLEYDVRSFVLPGSDLQPQDFILRAERFGVPQRRHRVILLGVRTDSGLGRHELLQQGELVTVENAIGDMPRIRSMISPRSKDSEEAFVEIRSAARRLAERAGSQRCAPVGRGFIAAHGNAPASDPLKMWLTDPTLGGHIQHESRAHMPADLMRYAYLSAKAQQGEFPRVNELPPALIPNHRNAARVDAPFADRFRVQRWDMPSTTVVSHISKDGHYYVHPDPEQMRSLSVREAARLQTFPDDYFFTGNRTQQYHQVGNAVPPLLARQLGATVAKLLGREIGVGQL
ncbi:DNA (cytosine-5)-methyltransferase 1 [Pedococcus dokdonensis]|uniref:DNA (cytosine-5-)-methyltransferase n=1 Tax=Pedococcus dokdonensis TaxID=443156 RepID=A0A1H0MDZ7_9MICO|nr:DNA (cytosine-5)-methyltransferase 1 [Pedococcus dokdonensis]